MLPVKMSSAIKTLVGRRTASVSGLGPFRLDWVPFQGASIDLLTSFVWFPLVWKDMGAN